MGSTKHRPGLIFPEWQFARVGPYDDALCWTEKSGPMQTSSTNDTFCGACTVCACVCDDKHHLLVCR